MKVPQEWETAGLPDEITGNLERPATGRWSVPGRLELDGGKLLYSFLRDDGETLTLHGSDPASHRAGLLTEFVALADQGADRLPRAVLRYAKRHGVLRICSHGLPASHSARCAPLSWPREPVTTEDPWWDSWEPVASWSLFAGQVRAMLNIAARLRNGKLGSGDDWKVLTQLSLMDPDEIADRERLQIKVPLSLAGGWIPTWVENVRRSQEAMPGCIETWLRWGDVRPLVHWPADGKPQFETTGKGLFGALALQLLLALTSQGGYVACPLCGRTFSPSRQGNRYCNDCRDSGEAHRAVARESLRRKRMRKAGLRAPALIGKPKEASK